MKLSQKMMTVIVLSVIGLGIAIGFFLTGRNSLSNSDISSLERRVQSFSPKQVNLASQKKDRIINRMIDAVNHAPSLSQLTVSYPISHSVFPPEFTEPRFMWYDLNESVDIWLIEILFGDSSRMLTLTRSEPQPDFNIDSTCILPNMDLILPERGKEKTWKPSSSLWQEIRSKSIESDTKISFYGFGRGNISKPVSGGNVFIRVSKDSVGAPIFYRDVPVMPVKNETGIIMPIDKIALPLVKWRLRDVSYAQSKVVMQNQPTCVNCHSFSRDGKYLASDIDGPESDKGGYALAPISPNMNITKKEMFSWNYDYKTNAKKTRTIGFISRVSPDGDYVATTLNEELFVIGYLTPKYLQVFYPTRGLLGFYSRKSGSIQLLPGADDTNYVHCNPVWTPDGKYIIFCRAKAKDPYVRGQKMPSYANGPEETPMQYSLYRIPFNKGKGGKAVPIKGASHNGMSNNYAKVSPDGKYIVFVKCRNGLLMRPDSKLWIVPIEGGEARLMECNTNRMNSWHSWSPNSRWMVFSSKANTFYTQMFLTHIDEKGISTPPILIPNSKADNRAVNIPEFVNINYAELNTIQVPAVKHYWNIRRADSLITENQYIGAVREFIRGLKDTEDKKVRAHIMVNLGGLVEDADSAIGYLQQAIQADPDYADSYFILASREEKRGATQRAIRAYYKVIEKEPNHHWARIRLAKIFITSDNPKIRNKKEALKLAKEAGNITHHRNVDALRTLAMASSEFGKFDEAFNYATDALDLAKRRGQKSVFAKLKNEQKIYLNKQSFSSAIVRKN